MACSMPPMYWSTGMQWRAAAGSNGPVGVPRVAEAQEVPRRVDEGVHGVGLAPGRAAADRAGRVQEALVEAPAATDRSGGTRRRRARGPASWSSGTGTDAVVGAVDDRDRAAPEALARDQPVAQPVVDLALADALLLEPVDGPGLRRGDVEAVEEAAVDLRAVAGVGPPPLASQSSGGCDGAHDRRARGAVAKSQSRSSSAGTAMIAPVP